MMEGGHFVSLIYFKSRQKICRSLLIFCFLYIKIPLCRVDSMRQVLMDGKLPSDEGRDQILGSVLRYVIASAEEEK